MIKRAMLTSRWTSVNWAAVVSSDLRSTMWHSMLQMFNNDDTFRYVRIHGIASYNISNTNLFKSTEIPGMYGESIFAHFTANFCRNETGSGFVRFLAKVFWNKTFHCQFGVVVVVVVVVIMAVFARIMFGTIWISLSSSWVPWTNGPGLSGLTWKNQDFAVFGRLGLVWISWVRLGALPKWILYFGCLLENKLILNTLSAHPWFASPKEDSSDNLSHEKNLAWLG